MADVMICAQSAQVLVDDGDRLEWVRADRTTAHADHPVVVEYPHLWRRLEINYPTSPLDPIEPVDAPADESPEPAAKDIRAWARAEGIDVPARGPIPDEFAAAYQAAHAADGTET